jgi:hypothetical protein
MKTMIEVSIVSSEHGFNDFEVRNLPRVHRVSVGHGIKTGDIFNVFCHDGVKLGGVWCGEVVKSLTNFAETHTAYLERFVNATTITEDEARNEKVCRGCGDAKTSNGQVVCLTCFKGEDNLFTSYKYFNGTFAEWLAHVEASRTAEATHHNG